MTAFHLPGNLNGIADCLSRGRSVPEWHLLPPAAEAIFTRWGIPEVDLFATRETAVVPSYVTLNSRDGSALFCDAFSQKWDFQTAWVFPPPSTIPRVLAHLNSAVGTYYVIAPRWTQCFWFPDLQARALAPPMTIENLSKVLIDWTTGLSPPQVDKLWLQAWKVGGGRIK